MATAALDMIAVLPAPARKDNRCAAPRCCFCASTLGQTCACVCVRVRVRVRARVRVRVRVRVRARVRVRVHVCTRQPDP